MKKARFSVEDILPLSLTLVVAGIGMAYGLNVLADTKDEFGEDSCADHSPGNNYTHYENGLCWDSTDIAGNETNSTAVGHAYFNGTADTITAVAKFPEKLGLIVTVIVAAIIIGVLVRYLVVR